MQIQISLNNRPIQCLVCTYLKVCNIHKLRQGNKHNIIYENNKNRPIDNNNNGLSKIKRQTSTDLLVINTTE